MVAKSDRPTEKSIKLPLPVPEGRLFRHAATSDILNLLAASPHTALSIRDLRRVTEHSASSVTDAVDLLEATHLVTISYDGNCKLVQINHERLSHPGDPILEIPQAEFRDPVRTLVDRVTEELSTVHGIVLFGSVARGKADRRSDIDCFVLVDDEQALAQQTAHEIASELSDERFDGDRFKFQVLVESTTTAQRYGDRLREIFTTGLTLVDSESLQQLKSEVLTNGR
ncbi:Predicted nucleotidyltransferase [Haladaptatus litoreus]|uniref:Predicted nucleotidyltransferase n=1 Tax=Haladaptatus litoreus TaxID=553468 RepID=A0A1N7CW20_9EURY|nr:nucleotidyltransferase domain-containing protein [Haladaptatus litoreus]SIR67730.1 Predicted nucleotidyltransferase [Haladaptatus litoreus]